MDRFDRRHGRNPGSLSDERIGGCSLAGLSRVISRTRTSVSIDRIYRRPPFISQAYAVSEAYLEKLPDRLAEPARTPYDDPAIFLFPFERGSGPMPSFFRMSMGTEIWPCEVSLDWKSGMTTYCDFGKPGAAFTSAIC
jgi:hypothetical protein